MERFCKYLKKIVKKENRRKERAKENTDCIDQKMNNN